MLLYLLLLLLLLSVGLLQGYQSEHTAMNETIESLEEKKQCLVAELEHLRARLTELENTETDLSAREQEIVHQKEALKQNVGQEEQGNALIKFWFV